MMMMMMMIIIMMMMITTTTTMIIIIIIVIIMMMMMMMMIMMMINNRVERQFEIFFTISSLRRELSPTHTQKWPGRNRVQITCNTSNAYHV